MGVEDTLTAWCVDEAVYVFGTMVEADLDSIPHKPERTLVQRRHQRLMFLLGVEDSQRFRSLGPPGR